MQSVGGGTQPCTQQLGSRCNDRAAVARTGRTSSINTTWKLTSPTAAHTPRAARLCHHFLPAAAGPPGARSASLPVSISGPGSAAGGSSSSDRSTGWYRLAAADPGGFSAMLFKTVAPPGSRPVLTRT